MTLSRKQILEYERKALDSIPQDHPHRAEIQTLLFEQVQSELVDLQTHANFLSTKRTV